MTLEPTQVEDGRAIIIDIPDTVTESLIFGSLKGSQPYVPKSWMAPVDLEDDKLTTFRLRYNSADVLTGIQLQYAVSGLSPKLEAEAVPRGLQE